MRICILSPDRPAQGLNGPRRIAEESARAFALLGHEVHVIGHAAEAPEVKRADGVWRHYVEIADRRLPGLERCSADLDLYAAVAKYQEVLNLHAEAPVDIVVATIWPGEGLLCLLDDRLATVTVLVTPVQLMLDRQMLAGDQFEAIGRVERAVAERSSYVHGTSSAIVADVEGTFGVSFPRSDLAPLFTDDRLGSSGRERYADSDQTEVLFIGRPEPRKGADVLIGAARLLERESRAVYVFVGPGDWDGLRAEVDADANLRGRVRFLGAVDEARLWRLYSGGDIVCVPSRYESFGYALIEAMMFGKALVATDVGGMPAIVEEGGNALLCPPDDPESLARCLERLIVDADLRNGYARRSRDLYLERYSPARGAQRTAALYASIAADHRHAQVAAAHSAAARERGVSPDGLTDALTEAVAGIAELELDVAHRVAVALLDGTTVPAGDVAGTVGEWQERALEAERQNAELRAGLDRITRSNSWRLTRPLRGLRRRDRGARRSS
jgi:glycosyltransferase involved in cell wall biosynthesis